VYLTRSGQGRGGVRCGPDTLMQCVEIFGGGELPSPLLVSPQRGIRETRVPNDMCSRNMKTTLGGGRRHAKSAGALELSERVADQIFPSG